jgi:hypothetical protein
MRQTLSQIQKKVIIIMMLALASIVAKAQSQTFDYTSIALTEIEEEEDINTVKLETFAVNISSSAASEKILEIANIYNMENSKTSIQKTDNTNKMATIIASELSEISNGDLFYLLSKAIEDTKRAKIENTYLRLGQK